MDLFTRCPHCDTVFRVTTRHLQASGGQVRCGRCEKVFDAFASLTAKPPEKQDNRDPLSVNSEESLDSRRTESVVAENKTAGSDDEREKPANRAGLPGENGGLKPQVANVTAASERPAHDPATNLFEWEFKAAPRNPRFGLWLTLVVAMLLLALGQATYIFRMPLVVSVPQVRPMLEYACQWMSCEIGLPRLTEQLHIDASDLQFIDPEKPNLVQLTALVRNRARVAVEYPALELTLTNAQEQVVARRVLLPDEYLAAATGIANGIPGRGEFSVRLFLDTGPLTASGYRIYLFYPG